MINLVPSPAKKKIRIEYIARLCVVTVVAVVCLLVICGSLLVPQIVLLRTQHAAIATQHQMLANENNAIENYTTQIEEVNTFINNVHNLLQFDSVVPLIESIQSYESSSISFQSISLRREGGAVNQVQVTGVSATRQALADLRERLIKDPLIQEVDLPIGNLAKDKNVSFNITVHLATDNTSS